MRFLRLLFFVIPFCALQAATFTWSGNAGDHNYSNPANWVGGVVPPNDGTAVLSFGDAADTRVLLPLVLNVARIDLTNSAAASYSLESPFFTLLSVSGGIHAISGGDSRIGDNIGIYIPDAQTIQVGPGTLELAGHLVGSGDVVKTGSGTLRVTGLNLLSGNTRVDSGTLLFANASAVPSLGTVTAGWTSHVGAESSSALTGLIRQIDATGFFGTLGLETAQGRISPAVFSETIDLTRLTSLLGVGSQTQARVTGTVEVTFNQAYRFGGGGGTIFLESNLVSKGSSLQLVSQPGRPLTLVLRGNNLYKGGTTVTDSLLVLDSSGAVAAGSPGIAIAGAGYVGATERFNTSTGGFLSMVNPTAGAYSIVGFDSVDTNAPRNITEAIDLSLGGQRADPYYLGTSSKIVLSGAITPTVGDSLYLTAVKGGHLIVASTLGTNVPAVVVGHGNSFDRQGGIVELSGRSTYTGGTQVLSGTLRLSSNDAAGTGAVRVGSGATLDITRNVVFSNQFSLNPDARFSGSGTVNTPGGAYFGRGAILSPGGNGQVGALTFASGLSLAGGSVLEFDFNSAFGTPGSAWDMVQVSGGELKLGDATSSPISVTLATISNGLDGWSPTQSYSWLVVSAGDISGFSSDLFAFNTSSFQNTLGGTFSMSQGSAGLMINFTPVPEPSTYVLLILGAGVVALWHRRRLVRNSGNRENKTAKD